MPVIPEGIAYAYTHETTQATTGYFSCQPPASLTLPQALARLEATPFDDFLRQHCLRQLRRSARCWCPSWPIAAMASPKMPCSG